MNENIYFCQWITNQIFWVSIFFAVDFSNKRIIEKSARKSGAVCLFRRLCRNRFLFWSHKHLHNLNKLCYMRCCIILELERRKTTHTKNSQFNRKLSVSASENLCFCLQMKSDWRKKRQTHCTRVYVNAKTVEPHVVSYAIVFAHLIYCLSKLHV